MSANSPSLLLYLASTNPAKLREFREAAAERAVAVEPLPGIAHLPPSIEDGLTFEANARRKALHFAAYTKGLVFADDSGIAVNALGGAPGIYSARYAGAGATDEANNQKLLDELRAAQARDRSAHYVCVIALARGERVLAVSQGRADGVILETPRGRGGFGYDPLFFYPPLGKTFAELSPDKKWEVSHRGRAFRTLLDLLTTLDLGAYSL